MKFIVQTPRPQHFICRASKTGYIHRNMFPLGHCQGKGMGFEMGSLREYLSGKRTTKWAMQRGAGNGGMAGSANLDNADSSPGDRGCHLLQLICSERRFQKLYVGIPFPKWMTSFDLLSVRCAETSFYILEWESREGLHLYLKEKLTLEP